MFRRESRLRGEIRLREELRANAREIVKRRIRVGHTRLSGGTLARVDRDLAVDLADLTRERVPQQVLTQLRDRLDRARPTRTLAVVRGGLVRTVESLVAHAIIIP